MRVLKVLCHGVRGVKFSFFPSLSAIDAQGLCHSTASFAVPVPIQTSLPPCLSVRIPYLPFVFSHLKYCVVRGFCQRELRWFAD